MLAAEDVGRPLRSGTLIDTVPVPYAAVHCVRRFISRMTTIDG